MSGDTNPGAAADATLRRWLEGRSLSATDRCLAILERFGKDTGGRPDWFLISPSGVGRGWYGAFGTVVNPTGEREWEVQAEGSLLGVLLRLVMACHSWQVNDNVEGVEFYSLLLGVREDEVYVR